MAHRSVPPSDLSLLGLVRHLAAVERYWFRNAIAGETVPPLYRSEGGDDVEFDVEPDPDLVDEAWSSWRAEVAFAEEVVARTRDLGELGRGEAVPVREVLVQMIEE